MTSVLFFHVNQEVLGGVPHISWLKVQELVIKKYRKEDANFEVCT